MDYLPRSESSLSVPVSKITLLKRSKALIEIRYARSAPRFPFAIVRAASITVGERAKDNCAQSTMTLPAWRSGRDTSLFSLSFRLIGILPAQRLRRNTRDSDAREARLWNCAVLGRPGCASYNL